MNIIEIKPLSHGAHRNQTVDKLRALPDGWAVIPDNMETPNFPFGELAVEKIGGVMTVTGWTAGDVPELSPETENEPSAQDDTDAMLIDHEYRLTLLELGINESEVTE